MYALLLADFISSSQSQQVIKHSCVEDKYSFLFEESYMVVT